MAPDTFATGDERREFTRTPEFLGKKVVRIINNTDAIKIPFIPPNIIPQSLSTHPKNTIFRKYLIKTAARDTRTSITQKRIKKPRRFLYTGEDIHFMKWGESIG